MCRLRSIVRPVSALFVFAFMLCAAPNVGAQGSDDDARKHFESGEAYFRTSDYEGALREFQRALQLAKPDRRPAVLMTIASVFERMGNAQGTVDTLEKYLAEKPDASDRATVELRIQNLRKRIAEQAKPEPSASAAVVPPPPPPPPTTTSTTPPPAPIPPPAPNRTAAWITLGVGGVATIGAVVTGILAKGKFDDAKKGCAKTPTGCSDSEIQPVKDMALVNTIFTGVAVVGVGVGTILYFTAKPSQPERATGMLPRVNAGVAPGGGSLEARWVF